jgi:hypothetical protein
MQNINAEFRGHHCEAVNVPMRLDGLGEYQSPQRDAELRNPMGDDAAIYRRRYTATRGARPQKEQIA